MVTGGSGASLDFVSGAGCVGAGDDGTASGRADGACCAGACVGALGDDAGASVFPASGVCDAGCAKSVLGLVAASAK
jgi:hypothetical protein